MPGMADASKKRELAQKARLEREAAERAAQERKKRLTMLGGVAAVIVVIIVAVLLINPFKEDSAEGAAEAKVTVDGSKVTIKGGPETTKMIAGLPQKGTTLGNPDAPATIVEFADMKCPACKEHEITAQAEIVDKLVRTGKANLQVQLINIIDPNMGTTDGVAARRAALNYAGQDKFWNFFHTSYFNQGDEQDQWATEKRLKEISAGSPGIDYKTLNTRETTTTRTLEAEADKLAEAVKASGTPAIFVKPRGVGTYTSVPNFNDVDDIASAVDEASKKAKATR
jgi:protein-disulfide isomerase